MSTTGPSTDTTSQAAPPPNLAPPAPVPPIRRLTRTRDDRMISGVSGGIARYLNVDATLVRLLMVVFGVIAFPFSIIGYLIAWAVMPQG